MSSSSFRKNIPYKCKLYIYIYIYILNNSPYGKKKPASDLKMKIYNESVSRGKNIYWKTKEKANLVIPIEKNQKTRNWLVKRKKTLFRLLSYDAKSAQY